MAEYRIVAKIDPQTAAGTNKVKQDLRGVQTEARATEQALNRSFDQAQFDRTIGGLVNRLEQLDKSINGLTASNATYSRSNETVGQSLDRAAASAAKATTQTQTQGKAATDTAASNARLEAALMRVLRATDQEAAEQARLNALLVDAKRLLDAGAISQERYAQVQQMAANTGKELNQVTGAQRIGMQQLGFQLGDVATMWSLGARPAQIFGSQIGQISQALMLMGGGGTSMLARVGAFLSGPWGIALTVGTIALTPLVAKLFEGNEALDDSIDKLRKDARETELAAKAKEAFTRTLEGVTFAIREQNKELKEGLETQRDVINQQRLETRTNLANLQAQRAAAAQALEDAKALYEFQKQRASGPGQNAEVAAAGLVRARERIAEAQKAYDEFAGTVALAEENVRRADAAFAQNVAERAVDPIKRITDEYERQEKAIIDAYAATGNSSDEALKRLTLELGQLEQRRKKALEAAQAQERLNKATTTGVATFRSREQAIGIAGRELQRAGLRVGENSQFGGVSGNHPGMGNSAHGKYAIDVNSGSGVVEADVPDLKAKFDAAAARYQSRGYRVLWNGWVYEANGNGPTRRIPAGQNQHRDHMHLEAPGTIVGKATQASTEAQFQREEGEGARAAAQAARLEERASDFVDSIVTKAASRGLPSNRKEQLQADIDEAFADFERRFNRAATFAEKWQISTALTDADARETARRFKEAYEDPLARLTALQGTTGQQREILNRKLEETEALGRALTPVEEKLIENSVLEGDQLERKAQILTTIRAPLEEYRAQVSALNSLFEEGQISLASYNARMAEMASQAASGLKGLPGVDPATGMAYEDVSAVADENARYAQQLEDFQNHREQLLQLGIDYNALEEQAHAEHVNRLAAIDQARKDQQIGAAEDIFGSLTSIAADAVGKQSAIYRGLFAVEKAFAIARAIMQIQVGIAEASANPFPYNLAAMASVAAATASIVSNIRSVTVGYKEGGYTGDGPVNAEAGVVHGKEFVINASATARNRPLLEAINAGRDIRAAERMAAPSGGGGGGERVVVQPTPAPKVEIRQINVTDPALVAEFLATPQGEQAFVNMMLANPEAVKQAANS